MKEYTVYIKSNKGYTQFYGEANGIKLATGTTNPTNKKWEKKGIEQVMNSFFLIESSGVTNGEEFEKLTKTAPKRDKEYEIIDLR